MTIILVKGLRAIHMKVHPNLIKRKLASINKVLLF